MYLDRQSGKDSEEAKMAIPEGILCLLLAELIIRVKNYTHSLQLLFLEIVFLRISLKEKLDEKSKEQPESLHQEVFDAYQH